MFDLIPPNIKAVGTATKWLTGIGLFVAWTMAVYFYSANHSGTACERDAAKQVATSASTALAVSEGFRVRDGQYLKTLQGANNDSFAQVKSNGLSLADAQLADGGLRFTIEQALSSVASTSDGGVPSCGATERSRQAASALGAALAECSQRRTAVAASLAEAITRGQSCETKHQAAVVLTGG